MFGCRSDNRRYYDLLGVPRDATGDDIKRAYRRAAMAHHPDKGGDPEVFKEVAQASQVLSDPTQRAVYDKYGEDGIKEGMGSAAGGGRGGRYAKALYKIASSMFHLRRARCSTSSSGGGRSGRPRRRQDVMRPLDVSLEQLYNGATKMLSMTRNVLCSYCKGTGGRSRPVVKCVPCGGSGVQMVTRKVASAMLPTSEECALCGGTGKFVANEWGCCGECKGRKVVHERKVLEVVVEQGMLDGHKFTFPAHTGEAPGIEAGDLVVVLRQRDHDRFLRQGDDLFYEHTLSLADALCGFQFVLTHLDGRQLLVKSGPGEVFKPGQFNVIDDEGMPQHRRPFLKGKLYIAFIVAFPDSLTPAQREAIAGALPAPSPSAREATGVDLGQCEETGMRKVDIEEEMRRREEEMLAREAYDDDDDVYEDEDGYMHVDQSDVQY